MRITIITGPFLPLPPVLSGAVNKIWHGLAKEFVKKGHEVTFLCRKHDYQNDNETINDIRYIRRMQFKRTNKIFLDLVKDFLYASRMAFIVPSADICVTNTFWLPIIVSRFRNNIGKIVVAVHRFPKRQLILYNNCNRLATVSMAVKESIDEQTSSVSHLVKVIPNPIDTSVFRPYPYNEKRKATKTIVYTGRVTREKGIHVLIRAFAQVFASHSNIRLRIVGPVASRHGGGGTRYMRELLKDIGDLPVIFTDPIRDPVKLAKVLYESDYYCYPSIADRGESFGVAPLEAMAIGLPTVVSDLGCFRDFIEDRQTGMVFNHRNGKASDNLAQVLLQLIENSYLSDYIAQNGAEKARDYSYENVADQYLRDWAEIIDK